MERTKIISSDQEELLIASWNKVKNDIIHILKRETTVSGFEELYRIVHAITLYLRDGTVYNGLTETIVDHLKTNVRPILETATDCNFIDELVKCYDAYTDALVAIVDVVLYVDRVYVPRHKLEPVKKLGLRLFREEVIDHPAIKERLNATVTQMRQGEPVDSTSLERVSKMLAALGVKDQIEN